MSNSIDTRVVEMKFDNAQFERGVAGTLKSLENLKKGTELKGASAGMDNLSKSLGHLPSLVGNLASNVQNISSRFSTAGIIGVTALASIATQAIATGATMVKNLTVAPLKAGLEEYETNLNSIQTILANTGLEGQKGLDQVNKALGDLNHYSDQTIYNFSEMAKNIGTFTAAGIKLEPATAAIKGIANLAAISGSNAEQASSAMYQLSQAMAAGKATLVDWNSVVNAGMGGKVFQEALKETARVQGVAVDDIIKKNGSFRDSLQEGWLTTEVLSATLQKFTGDMSAAQLKQLGYSDKQIAAIIKMGKTAQDAATKVKTVSQLINTLQEAMGSGWSQTFQLLFGDFEEARTLFTNINNVLGGFVQNSNNARNKVLGDWKALGGRTVLIKGIAIAFANLMDIISPIQKAFRDIFPAATGKQLYNLTVGFRDLMASMRLGEDTMDNIRATFRGLFAILDIGWQILKGVFTTLKTAFSGMSDGNSGILEFTGNIGDWLVALDKAIKKGEGFHQFFVKLGAALKVPIKFLRNLIGAVGDATQDFAEFGTTGVGDFLKNFHPMQALGEKIKSAFDGVIGVLKKVWSVFQPLSDKLTEFFAQFGDSVSEGVDNTNWDRILSTINTALFGGLVLLMKKFLANGLSIDFGGGFMGALKDSLEGLTGTLGAMQSKLKAEALLKLALAIGVLAISVKLLSTIDPKQLTSAMAGLAVGFGQLVGAMALLNSVMSVGSLIKMPILTASLIALGAAILLLSVSVKNLASLDWNGLAKGLTGVAVLLGSLALFTKFANISKGGIASSVGLILLATAIKLLVDSVSSFAGMSWGEIIKGLVGVAGLLGALTLFTQLSALNKGAVAQGAGLLILALGIKVLADAVVTISKLSWGDIGKGLTVIATGLGLIAIALNLVPVTALASAAAIVLVALSFTKIAFAVAIVVKALDSLTDVIKKMGQLSWGEILKGLTVMAVSIGLIGAALYLLPKTAIFSAAAIIIVAQAITMIGKAMSQMGGMSWGEIAKSLVVLAGSLTIIAAALYVMTAAIPGALAVLVIAAALRVLAPVLIAFGEMSWGEIAKGLVALAGVFLVLGLAGLALAPVVPVLISLGGAIVLLGLGALAAGAGMLLFSTGLAALAVSGTAGAAAFVAATKTISGAIPVVMKNLALGIIQFANTLSTGGVAITKAMVTVLLSLMSAINKTSPKIVSTLGNLLLLLLQAMIKYVPKMADAGQKILTGVLQAIANNIGKVVTAGTNIVVNFLKGIQQNLPRVIQEGVNTIISFINGVADGIRNNSSQLGAAGGNLASAIVEGMVRGIAGGVGAVVNAAKNLAQNALDAAKSKLGINSPSKEFEEVGKFSTEGLAGGLVKYKTVVTKAAENVGSEAIESLRGSLSGISDILTTDANFQPIIRPVLDLTDVKKNAAQIGSMLPAAPIKVTTTYAKAKDASAGFAANRTAQDTVTAASSTTFEYTQINQSPKALSSAEIYRQTNNQLSTVKGALKNAN